jgi:hypothetical protein
VAFVPGNAHGAKKGQKGQVGIGYHIDENGSHCWEEYASAFFAGSFFHEVQQSLYYHLCQILESTRDEFHLASASIEDAYQNNDSKPRGNKSIGDGKACNVRYFFRWKLDMGTGKPEEARCFSAEDAGTYRANSQTDDEENQEDYARPN